MLILLPLGTFVLVFLTLNGLHFRRNTPEAGWQLAFLQTAALTGAYMVIFSELLSLFNALTTFWVALCWAGAGIGVSLWGWKTGLLLEGKKRLVWFEKPEWFDVAAGAVLGLILVFLFIVAIKSPTNNNDSLQYHMARVAHWVQSGSLEHYATAFIPQLSQPIFAELAILNAFVLTKMDFLANLVQWGSLAVALVAVSKLAGLLGAGKKGQWLAVAFLACLPTGLLEATSTQNDLVTAFWLVMLVIFILRSDRAENVHVDAPFIGVVFGLGLLTKGTFYPYSAIPMAYYVVRQFIRNKPGVAVLNGIIIGSIVLTLNLGYWSRNMVTFGTPLGPKTLVSKFTNSSFPSSAIGGTVRNTLLNFVTPDEPANEVIVDAAKSALGSWDPGMDRFSLTWAWNHEDLAGNPLHMMAVFIVVILFFLYGRRKNYDLPVHYLLITLASFILLSGIVKFDPFGTRYQLPFFAIFAPVFGLTFEKINFRQSTFALVILMLLTAFPWVLFNRTRPLIAMRESSDPFTVPCFAGCTAGSILNEPPENTLLAVWSDRKDDYILAMQLVEKTACTQIGLKLDSSDLEYAYWWLLDAPRSGLRLESIDTYPELERYLDPSFTPCVAICTTCASDQTRLGNLDLIGEYHRIKIYALPEFKP